MVVEIERLRKTYRGRRGVRRAALDGFDMAVSAGEVHGFLGPNGSGKTTTLRTLVGLVAADAGTVRLFGEPVPQASPHIADRVGAIVEGAQFFPHFTARRTLELLATIGHLPVRRVGEVLDIVRLADRADDRISGFSLGMRQRLAVASALLRSPDLLILDEPANGLDPAGIRQMRDLLRGLAASGTTVVLSSHILAEVQLICDHVTIIARGTRVAHGPVAQVLSQRSRGEYRVAARDLDQAARLLAQAGATVRVSDGALIVGDAAGAEWISSTLGRHQVWATEIVELTADLESVFFDLTDGNGASA